MQVTWVAITSGHGTPVDQFRLTWTENGTLSADVAWTDHVNTSYTIAGLRPSTVYQVCVEAVTQGGGQTQCEHFSTEAAAAPDNDDKLLIIIIAAAAGAFLLLLLLIIVIICCCCCCRRHDDASSTKRNATVHAVESTRSVNRGRLAEHSVVSVSVYENLP